MKSESRKSGQPAAVGSRRGEQHHQRRNNALIFGEFSPSFCLSGHFNKHLSGGDELFFHSCFCEVCGGVVVRGDR